MNIVISIFLAMRWGEIGAALGTTISLVVANGIIMNWFYHKKIGIDIIYFWKQIGKFIPALILPIIVGIVLNIRLISSLIGFAVRVVVYSAVYCLSFYFLGLNDFEKEQIRKILRKLRIVK